MKVLGWHGTPVTGVRLLDTELTVVVSPQDDGLPVHDGPPALDGVLVPVDGSWRHGLSIARACLPFAPAALRLSEPPSELCLLECGYADVGIVVGDEVVLAPRPRRTASGSRRTIDRALRGELERVLSASSAG
ncbi:hypothetical protein [Cryptosporangium phraense]|uniref:Uncharacterized protein n=1 Tax=Cryptosporangium phraense TaxID=2593070 RepID=A0A545APN9_9ACTN|nr:hypothetical protein [Cryptosporangium phraense]TQS43287.1 hypothetical protein FL583_20850 [Cryptosporangium phraense]